MSWGITATQALIASIAVTGVAASAQMNAASNAQKDAEKQAKEDRANALKAEAFAETQGEGQGMLGNINLAIDQDVDDDADILAGRSNISL